MLIGEHNPQSLVLAAWLRLGFGGGVYDTSRQFSYFKSQPQLGSSRLPVQINLDASYSSDSE